MPDNIIQGGTLANYSGSTLEKTIIGTLVSKGFLLISYRDYENYLKRHGEQKTVDKYGTELLLRNVPFQTIYNHPGNTEFLLQSERYNLEIRIEAKWQQSSGSVDEKFPYLYLNCLEAMPESEIMIIVDGGGAKAGAINWLRNAVKKKIYSDEKTKEKNIKVFNLTEFIAWVNKRFR